MSRDIRMGRWLQLRGRLKMAWARLIGDEPLAADASADVVAGALQETYGVAKKQTVREVTKGIDALAAVAKRTARAIER
jgi:uncharacterized protein YjbJ (UPF0337 family)